MGNYDEIVKGLQDYTKRNAMTGKDKNSLADEWGSSRSTLYRAISEKNPKLPGSKELCDWLDKVNAKITFPGSEADAYAFVPFVTAVAGAGESWVTDKTVEGLYAFKDSFLKGLGVSKKDVVLMTVSGDSMEPLIHDKDAILVDTRPQEIHEGYIYVISLGETLSVKRLQKTPHGWNICSDNKNYPPLPVEGQELDKLTIVGRVRWFGRIM